MKPIFLMIVLAAVSQPEPRIPKYSFGDQVFVREENGIFAGVIHAPGRYDVVYRQYFYPVLYQDGRRWYCFRQPESHIGKTRQELVAAPAPASKGVP